MDQKPTLGEAVAAGLVSTSGAMAVFWAASSAFMLACLWVIVRNVSDELDSFQITFMATLFGFLMFLPVGLKRGVTVFKTRRFSTHLIRATFNGLGVMAWFWALTLMQLADAAALNLLMPVVVAIFAMIFLGEKVGPRRWAALAVGICGALIIVRPGFQEVGLGVWLVLCAVVCGASHRVIAKSLTRTESSTTSVLYLMGLMVPVTLLPAMSVWTTPSLSALAGVIAIGALLTGAHFTFMHSITLADVSALEPVNFTRLLFAAVLGFFFFAETPSIWTLIGGLLIIASTTYVARREAALKSEQLARPDTGGA